MSKIEKMKFNELCSLYGIVSELCADYAKMTDGYSLATGDEKFEHMPLEMREMIGERQKFFGYKSSIKYEIKKRIEEMFERNEQDKKVH